MKRIISILILLIGCVPESPAVNQARQDFNSKLSRYMINCSQGEPFCDCLSNSKEKDPVKRYELCREPICGADSLLLEDILNVQR